jgi:hypothetical protein
VELPRGIEVSRPKKTPVGFSVDVKISRLFAVRAAIGIARDARLPLTYWPGFLGSVVKQLVFQRIA